MISTTFKAIGTACVVAAAARRHDRADCELPRTTTASASRVLAATARRSKLKVKHDDGRIEVEFEADQNRNGVRWNVEFRRNGRLVFTGARTTVGAERLVQHRAQDRRRREERDDPRPRDAQRRGLQRDGEAADARAA